MSANVAASKKSHVNIQGKTSVYIGCIYKNNFRNPQLEGEPDWILRQTPVLIVESFNINTHTVNKLISVPGWT